VVVVTARPISPEAIGAAALASGAAHPNVTLEATLYYLPMARVGALAVEGKTWDRLARCESGGNWAINSGKGYYGGLQFDLATWSAYGGTNYTARPDLATREEQITVGEALYAKRGFQPWPSCRAKLGLP
jgi:hypothetical protein